MNASRVGKSFLLSCFALCAISSSAIAADYNDGHGKIWRQPSTTMGMSWNTVDGIFPNDGFTPASGGAYDGWVWATQLQTIELFNRFLPPNFQLTLANPGMEAMLVLPFGPTTVFAMNGAPYSFLTATRGWTATLNDAGEGIRGTYAESGNSVSFFASIGVNDPYRVDLAPGFLNETGVWMWRPDPNIPEPTAAAAIGLSLIALLARRTRSCCIPNADRHTSTSQPRDKDTNCSATSRADF